MGLDMYLSKRVRLSEDRYLLLQLAGIVPSVDWDKVDHIQQECMYWRKANAIHKWFVDVVQDGVDDCKEYYCSKEQLKALLDLVNRVLQDNSLAEELLPTTEGFFFGDTGYDDGYFDSLKSTQIELERALQDIKNNNLVHFIYQSSW